MRLVLVSAIAALAIICAQAAPQFDNYESRGWGSTDFSPHDGRRTSYQNPGLYGAFQPPVYPQFQPQNDDPLSNGDHQGSPNQCWDPASQVYRLNPSSQSYNNEFFSRDNRSPQRGLNPYFADPYLPPSRQNWNGIHGPSPPPPPPHQHEHAHGRGHGHGGPPPHHGHGGPPPPPPPHHGHGHGTPPPPPGYGFGHGGAPPPPPPHHGHGGPPPPPPPHHGHGHGTPPPPPGYGFGHGGAPPPPPPHHGHGGPPPPPPPHHGHGHGTPPPPPGYGFGHSGGPPPPPPGHGYGHGGAPPPPPPGHGYGHGIPPPGRRPPHNPQNVGDNDLEICKDTPKESTTPNPVEPEETSNQGPSNIPTSYPGLQIPDKTVKQEDIIEQTTTHGSVKTTTEFDWNNFVLGASVDNTGGAGVIDVRMGKFSPETTPAPS